MENKSKTKQIPHHIHLSAEQDELLSSLQAASGMNKSELFRAALVMIGHRYNIRVPKDGEQGGVPKRGKHKRG